MTITKLYGLIGSPLGGTKSPWIHNSVFKYYNIPGIYMAFELSQDQFENGLKGLKALGVEGFSVTIPYKTDIMLYLDEIEPMAKQLGAVNVVQCKEGKWIGYNTDGTGLLSVLQKHIPDLCNKNVLVLGAGGAARGICGTLLVGGIASLGIWNRTSQKAEELVTQLNASISTTNQVKHVKTIEEYESFDLIINTTSVGMEPNIEAVPADVKLFKKGSVVCDIVYKPHWTKFLKEAHACGHPIIFGIEMLIEQAMHAQSIWLGLSKDELEPIRQRLLNEFEGQKCV